MNIFWKMNRPEDIFNEYILEDEFQKRIFSTITLHWFARMIYIYTELHRLWHRRVASRSDLWIKSVIQRKHIPMPFNEHSQIFLSLHTFLSNRTPIKSNREKTTVFFFAREKEGDLTQSYDKTPYTNRKFENQRTTHKRHQKLRLHNDCGPT